MRSAFGNVKNFPLFQFGKNPTRDWKILVFFFGVFLVCTLFFGLYLYRGVTQGDIFKVSDGVMPIIPTIDRALLSKTINAYDAKNRALEKLKTSPPRVVDPSR